MIFIFGVGFVTGVGLSLTVLFVTFLDTATRVDQAVDPESALIWRETESRSLKQRGDSTVSAAANALGIGYEEHPAYP
jgi:hypothetical protein